MHSNVDVMKKRLAELEFYLQQAAVQYQEISGRIKEVKQWIEDTVKAEEQKKAQDRESELVEMNSEEDSRETCVNEVE